MLGFLIKKSFFDGWDHLLVLVLANAGFLLFLSLGVVAGLTGLPAVLSLGLLVLAGFGLVWCFAVTSLVTLRWSDFQDFPPGELRAAMTKALLPALQIGLLLVADVAILIVGVPFYLARGIGGAIAAGVLIWFSIGLLLSLQFYLPLRFRLGGGFRKNLRKGFMILVDNPGFSLFVMLWSLLSFAFSIVLAMLAPGPTGIALFQNDALKLRLRKYDWLEEASSSEAGEAKESRAKRRKIPWKELFTEFEELLGKRTLKGMIFPWRE